MSLSETRCQLPPRTVGIGSSIWDELTNLPRPKELHPFREVKGAKHSAVSTPRPPLPHPLRSAAISALSLGARLMDRLGDSIFPSSVLVASEDDPDAQGGSYVVVQKYVHDLAGWKSLSTEQQEQVIGRTKPDNIELDDAEEGKQASHKTLSTIEDEDGQEEHDILRDNMPFGSPASGEFGTYFIGYTSRFLAPSATVLDGLDG
ncbi:uncharacterized protein N7515_005160 [Penicillium bovifimosum]|uniref:Uncharacterized protein n=1 Tax=Penicillium bovifimosum TaxID=126998 RepID=A0A9W9H1J5_9EURO|nr:uncharacterized protein N7515_005160 [Penicillium bovifimosum]KAJ5135882.1 hypothetical protein N7515_005160 [Penicillium bovifimosum]